MILVDLNVILDVVQKREPHYRSSAAVLEKVIEGEVAGMLPAHAVTTAHYVVDRYGSPTAANRAVDWLLKYFAIVPVGHAELKRARVLGWPDFEDAVVAVSAEAAKCKAIVTRNVRDFRDSPIAPLTPDEYLLAESRS